MKLVCMMTQASAITMGACASACCNKVRAKSNINERLYNSVAQSQSPVAAIEVQVQEALAGGLQHI